MKKYIDADALCMLARTDNLYSDFGRSMADLTSLRDLLEDAPAADVAEVVHGEWMQCKTQLGKIYSVCSNCKTDFKFKTDKGTFARLDMNGMPYCPNCGARMDGKDGE